MNTVSWPSARLCASERACWNLVVSLSKRMVETHSISKFEHPKDGCEIHRFKADSLIQSPKNGLSLTSGNAAGRCYHFHSRRLAWDSADGLPPHLIAWPLDVASDAGIDPAPEP